MELAHARRSHDEVRPRCRARRLHRGSPDLVPKRNDHAAIAVEVDVA